MTSSQTSLSLIRGVLASEQETRRLGHALIRHLQRGDVVLLEGPLGAGKTALARAMIRIGLPPAEAATDIPSPTFTLVQVYETSSVPIWHFDLYRIEAEDDILELGWEDALDIALCLVEWPDRLGSLKPADCLEIRLELDGERRLVSVIGHGTWRNRLTDEAKADLARALGTERRE